MLSKQPKFRNIAKYFFLLCVSNDSHCDIPGFQKTEDFRMPLPLIIIKYRFSQKSLQNTCIQNSEGAIWEKATKNTL